MDVYTLLEKIEQGDIKYVKRFIRSHPDRVSQPGSWGDTPLMHAIQNRKTNIVKLLLDAGADVNWRHKLYGDTALHLAVSGKPEAVAILLQHPTIQVNLEDNGGRTPLHLACFYGHTDIVGSLLSHIGIKPNVVNKDGDTPLHWAVQRKRYDVVTLMLSKDSVELEVKNHEKMTPLLEAISPGHLGIINCLIARGANVNDVDGEGNSCLHLALKREVFNSEGAPMDILNECCTDLSLKTEEMFTGGVVARYLTSLGADFHHKNNNNNTPLDLIKDPNLRKKFETFLPPKCLWCRNKEATTKVHPCGHLVTCEECSNTPLKRCLRCAKPVTNRTGNEKRTFEDKEMQTLAEPIVCPKFDEKASQTLPEPVETPTPGKKFSKVSQPTPSTSQPVGFQALDERFLLNVACQLGGNWWKVGIFLGIKSTQLGIIRHDFSGNVQEQSFQMLLYWSTHCDPQEVTMDTLRAALEEAECLLALECLTLNVK